MIVKRPDYYEDDAVYYTTRGKRPIIPKKYQYCNFYIKGNTHTLKSFTSKLNAKIALNYAMKNPKYFGTNSEITIFKCTRCGLYHIMLTKNYENYKVSFKSN